MFLTAESDNKQNTQTLCQSGTAMTPLNLLLIGKTGNGKSATGNSILGRKVFRSVASTSLVTREIQCNYSEYNERYTLKVVDTPGIIDTVTYKSDPSLRIKDILSQAIAASPSGYDAILYVVKFNGQFTQEDLLVMEELKRIFGENVVKNHCVLIMTHGDNYDAEENGNFIDWCSNQEGWLFKELFLHCGRRVVQFDNKTKDEQKRNCQLDSLLQILDTTNQDLSLREHIRFQEIQEQRKKLREDPKQPRIKEEDLKQSSLIVQKLGQINLSDPEKQISSLEKLKGVAEDLLRKIRQQDDNTGSLRDYIGNAINVKNCVEDQLLSTQDAGEFKREKEKLQAELQLSKKKMKTLIVEERNKEDEGRKTKETNESSTGEASMEESEIRKKEQEVEEYSEMIKQMELRLKEDASKVEEENSDLIYEWLAEFVKQTQNSQNPQTKS
ncbi:hypothetical protein Btru_033101 [Bulinus truncatus]|nr:hypothetical protein Btru_033101 [Bulinus truncatus]